MKTHKQLCVLGIVLGLTGSVLMASKPTTPQAGGTSILHLLVRKTMANPGILPDASGKIALKQNKQGQSNLQQLDIIASHLETNAPYQLLALLGDDTNFTQVADISSDADGKIALRYRRVDTRNGNNGHLGHGKSGLLAALNPVSNLRGLAIQNVNTQAVLIADLTAPDKLEYLIKRPLNNDGFDADAAGSLRLKSNLNDTHFRLLASGLEPTNTYYLVLNGSINETNSTDADGRLTVTTALVNPTDVLDLRTIAIWDSASNSVLSTHLP